MFFSVFIEKVPKHIDSQQRIIVFGAVIFYIPLKPVNIVPFIIFDKVEHTSLIGMSFGKMEASVFLMRLQEQDDYVASWSPSTIDKIRQVLIKILVENEYLDNTNSAHLNPVLISRVLEDGIRENGDEIAFPAFNFFE